MTISTKLYPCDIPPQMRLLVTSPSLPSINFEQTVTHGDTYNLPGEYCIELFQNRLKGESVKCSVGKTSDDCYMMAIRHYTNIDCFEGHS